MFCLDFPEVVTQFLSAGIITRMNTPKTTCLVVAGSILGLSGCSTTHPTDGAKADSETVLVTYHVQSGKEAELQAVLAHAWEVYRSEQLAFANPHFIVQDTEDGGKPRFVEVFTWISSATPEHAPESVKAIWRQEESLCEGRNGHDGIQPNEVKLITGR
jgi:hypothetical protein